MGGAETCSGACRTCWRGTRRTAKALEFLRLGRERTANGSRRASQGSPHKLSAERTRPSSSSPSRCMVQALLVTAVEGLRVEIAAIETASNWTCFHGVCRDRQGWALSGIHVIIRPPRRVISALRPHPFQQHVTFV